MYPPLPLPQCCCKHCLRDDLMCKNQHFVQGVGGGHKKVYELISTIGDAIPFIRAWLLSIIIF